MSKTRKIIFWTSLVFLGLAILFPLIRKGLEIQFATDDMKSNYEMFISNAIPLAILLTLFGTIKSEYNLSKTVSIVALTLVISIGSMYFMFLAAFSDLCSYTNVKTIYQLKDDPNTKIMIREFGCGAVDSGPPSVGVHRVQYYTKYFIRTSRIDTNQIDKNQWIKIP